MGERPQQRRGQTVESWLGSLEEVKTSDAGWGIPPERIPRYVTLLEAARSSGEFDLDLPVFVARAPGRWSDFGNHIDLKGCGGPVSGTATLQETISVVQGRGDGRVVLLNTDPEFPRKAFPIDASTPAERIGDIGAWDRWTAREFRAWVDRGEDVSGRAWDKYIRGLVAILRGPDPLTGRPGCKRITGMTALFSSDVPRAGGCSSSSALVVNAALALDTIYDLGAIPRDEFIDLIGLSEWYAMTRGGCADPARILYARRNSFVTVASFPTRIMDTVAIPEGIVRVIVHSGVDRPQDDETRNAFRSSAACFPLAVLWIKKLFPEYRDILEENDPFYRIGYLREFTRIGRLYRNVPLLTLYDRVIRSIPPRVTQADLIRVLADFRGDLETIFENHDEPDGGYPLRDAAVFGLAEIERSAAFPEACRAGDIDRILTLYRLSHDGDRVTRFRGPRCDEEIGWDYRVTDGLLDAAAAALARDPGSPKGDLARHPGRFGRSIPEMDRIADLVSAHIHQSEAAIRIMGAGKGGEMEALVRRDALERFIHVLESYLSPGGATPGAPTITVLKGSGDGASVIEPPSRS